jgi:integrase
MARQRKKPDLVHCKLTQTSHPKAPWRVSWPVEREGKPVRVSKRFATEAKAWKHAEKTELDIANHGVRFGELPPEARRAFDFYRDTAAELGEVGATVPRFEQLVADALAAIREEYNSREANALTVAEGIPLFTAYKAGRVGKRQLDNLKLHLKRFAQDFGTRPMRSIGAQEIEAWLSSLRNRKNPDNLPVPPVIGPVARNAYRTSLFTFFNHGANPSRGWCVLNPIVAIESEKITTTEPRAYTPQTAAKIMQAALSIDSPLLPALALEMFAGIRPSEAMALDLAAVDLAAADFRVPALQRNGQPTKTGARIAPLLPAAKSWLAAQPRRTGFAYEGDRNGHSREMRRILKAAGVTGIHDGARHSFISYRTAKVRDVARVADECGNSVQVIKTNYRKIVTEAAGTAFFAIRPKKKAENVTNIEEGRQSA